MLELRTAPTTTRRRCAISFDGAHSRPRGSYSLKLEEVTVGANVGNVATPVLSISESQPIRHDEGEPTGEE